MHPLTHQTGIRLDELNFKSKELQKELDDKENSLNNFNERSKSDLNEVKNQIVNFKKNINNIKKELLNIIHDIQNKGKIEDIERIKKYVNNLELENRANYNDLKYVAEKKIEQLKQIQKK